MNAEDYFVVGGALVLGCALMAVVAILMACAVSGMRNRLRASRDRAEWRRHVNGTGNVVVLIGGAAICWALARLPQ